MDHLLNTQSPPPALLLRGREVAELLGCSRALAYRLMQQRTIPTVRLPGGRSIRVPRAALLEWIDKRTESAGRTATTVEHWLDDARP